MDPTAEGNLVRNWACALPLCPYGAAAIAAQSPLQRTLGPWGQEWDAIADEAVRMQDELFLRAPFLTTAAGTLIPQLPVDPPSLHDIQGAVEALLRLWKCPAAVGQIVNIGHDEEVNILRLAEMVIEECGTESTIERVPYEAAYRSGFQDMPRRRPDLRKLESLTGFRPQASAQEVVRRVVRISPG